MSDSPAFRSLLEADKTLGLDPSQIERAVQFREEVLKENEIQNLTRLLSPQDFLDGHVRDVVHLHRSNLVTYPAMDLGAGMGVPGLFYALLYGTEGGKEWISCDSEASKAGFSQRMIDLFGLEGVTAEGIRAEEVLDNQEVGSIVARAVGPVSRIYGWIRTRSTWNNLVLLKGPKWTEEWADFTSSPQKNKLRLAAEYKYAVGQEEKQRIIVKLARK